MNFASAEDAWKKVDEELKPNFTPKPIPKKEQELGRCFLSLINYARISGLNSDSALERNQSKIHQTFPNTRKIILEKNLNLAEMPLEEMDILWEEAKKTV